MGNQGSYTEKPVIQRIRPTPGSSGTRLRKKNFISVYCEATHSIFSVKVDFEKTVQQFKTVFPIEHMQLWVDDRPVNDTESLRAQGLTERSLVKVINSRGGDGSTEDSSAEELIRYIGPKPCLEGKPAQPSEESSLLTSEISSLNLSKLAVPDLQLSTAKPPAKKTFSE